MNSYRIALLPGDGIGPECMDATRVVLDQLVSEVAPGFYAAAQAAVGYPIAPTR